MALGGYAGPPTTRMGLVCAAIAWAHGLDERGCGLLARAAPMRDVGMAAIPDAIRNKLRLTTEEYEAVKTHAEIGGRMIGARMLVEGRTERLRLAQTIARTHHERWNGKGYPAGLAGEEIPLAGRIAAIADAFDVLTTDRPMRPAWGAAEAAAEIERGAGTFFDPALVGAFRRALAQIVPARGVEGGSG